jgi:hypothetical protein
MVKPVSPYLLRPLRTLEAAQRDVEATDERERRRQAEAPPPQPRPDGQTVPVDPQDTVSIAGQPVAVPAPTPAAPAAGARLDVKA